MYWMDSGKWTLDRRLGQMMMGGAPPVGFLFRGMKEDQ